MESPHLDYEYQIFLGVQEVELGKSTHHIYRDQDAGNFNSSMDNYTGNWI